MCHVLIKVQAYDKMCKKWIYTYINPEKIIMLNMIEDKDEGDIYFCYLPDIALRLSESSYHSIIRDFYGKEYMDGNKG